MRISQYFILFIIISFFHIGNTNANINLTVSPLKYEIEANTGSIITRKATLFNKSDQIHTIVTGKSDFESKDNTGKPYFIRQSELVFKNQELSSWININTDSFIINPGEKKEIEFQIQIPNNATPGGHYGAIFFKNNNSEGSSGGQININVDYGVLILVNIAGDIIENAEVEKTTISKSSSSKSKKVEEDNCLLIDLTNSKNDGKCIDTFIDNEIAEKNGIEEEIKDKIKEIEEEISNFNIDFDTLFINEGNTHLKPNGKIKLVNEEGKEIKGIGKEVIKNDVGAIIGEKIVDYLPINDNGGNVLPSTKRMFNSEWRGFPYEGYDQLGKKIIKYWTPEEYYTRKNVEERGFLLPWERVNERINHKKIKAIIELGYINKDGEEIEFNSAEEFYVDYKEKYIGLNPYFFIFSFIVVLFVFLLWLIFRKKKLRCTKCERKTEKDMKICPYCGTKQ